MSEPSGTDARLDRIKALTEQLEAARADAKEAEAYAEELEAMNKNQEAMIRQADRRGDALEAKLATCEKYRDAYAECDSIRTQAVRDRDANLAKLVSIAKRITSLEDTTEELAECGCARCKAHLKLRATLAEIEGEKT
jgi:predicted  nucleic acid-binding Zn-ribbon protein